MTSLSFDHVAHVYDATRGYPPAIGLQIAQALEQATHATARTSFLEVGVGTGRIALPLASRGHRYTGVDISERMMRQLEAKLKGDGWQEQDLAWGTLPDEDPTRPSTVSRFANDDQRASMRLVRSDMTQLPFKSRSFDVVIAVHVFHLVDGWQGAIDEVLRVLRPGGNFLHCWDENSRSDMRDLSEQWHHILRELGYEVKRPGTASVQQVDELLRSRGLVSKRFYPLTWEQTTTPRQAFDYIAQRLWSSTWAVPDDLFARSTARLKEWVEEQYGSSMDTPLKQERRFVISKVRV